MAEQKAKARAAWAGTGQTADDAIWFDLAEQHGPTEFLGYDTEHAEGQVLAIISGSDKAELVSKGDTVQIVVNQTPFYAESGGQVGDCGLIRTETGTARITDTKKVAGIFRHIAESDEGEMSNGQGAELAVDHLRRTAIRANHSATHLLHEALRQELGEHVAQRGSLNAPDRLRFDFSHSKAMTRQELDNIGREVNAFIRQNSPVETRIMTPDDAREIGAQALFGEKYGDEVRVVSMGHAPTGKGPQGETWSIELCGGTHVERTGDIGLCVVLGDSASSAGVRRIEALTGKAAIAYVEDEVKRLAEVAGVLKAQPGEVVERVRNLLDERKALTGEVAQLRRELAMSGGKVDGPIVREINGVKFAAMVVPGVPGRDLPALIDAYKTKIGSGAMLLIAEMDGKVAVASGVTSDLTDKLSAVDLVRAAVAEMGGKGGGGRADLAQGGARDASNSQAAIEAAEAVLGG